MTPERWRRVEPIFDQALDLAGEARRAYLDTACGDPELRAEVEALLAADRDSGEFLQGSAESFLGHPNLEIDPTLPADIPANTVIGPYRVVRPLGRGGMGQVYLGERADGQFEQVVAIKLIRQERNSALVHRRFLAERQILARLEHPNIARLVDGGLTADGFPWLAMEYVEGAPLLAWCDQHALTPDGRITLFLRVAEAVRYAHQNLVVHRDLKPSNLLVAGDGQVKLLDFGIAKVLNPGLTDQPGDNASPATETGLLMLTPEYAAPEQIRGEPVTTATDVYALGAVLYELLTGSRAHQFDRRTPGEMERVICEQDPVAPSSATPSKRLRQALRGDLDTIILTALQKQPARRYSTVDALVEDLKNYQGGLPIRARPAALGYRFRKFIRRHRVGVFAGATLALALAGGVAATLWQSRAAAREATRAQAVKEFLMGLFQSADPAEARGREITARELLARGVTKIDSALAAQPALKEELLSDLGRIHRDLGLYDPADSLLRRAVVLASETWGENSREYATRLTEWGAISRLAGHAARADSLLKAALDLRRRILGPKHPDVATTLTELSLAADDQGDTPRANDLARQAMNIDRQYYGPTDLHVARDLELLARLHSTVEAEEPMADSAYRAALNIYRQHYDAGHPDVLRVKDGIATNLRRMRRFPESEALHREVLAEYRKLHPEGHPDVATAMYNLSQVLERQGKYVEAESLLVGALVIRRRMLGENGLPTVEILNDLGVLQAEKGDTAKAEATLREASDRGQAGLGAGHPSTLSALGNLAVVLTRQSKLVEAESVLRQVVAGRRLSHAEQPGLSRALSSLGIVLRDMKRYAEAEAAFKEAADIARLNLEPRRNLLALAQGALGVSLVRQGRLQEAEPVLEEAVTMRRAYLDSSQVPRLWDERHYGNVLLRLRKFAAAESVLVPSFRNSGMNPGATAVRRDLAVLLVNLYRDWGRPTEARKYVPDTLPQRRSP